MTKTELMQRVRTAIDRRAEDIIGLGEEIRRQPELGFKEFKTSRLVAQTFERMGLPRRSTTSRGAWRSSASPPRSTATSRGA
jgi:metal-dependent amidase/aminoacylase/carboxypeptidase family protein